MELHPITTVMCGVISNAHRGLPTLHHIIFPPLENIAELKQRIRDEIVLISLVWIRNILDNFYSTLAVNEKYFEHLLPYSSISFQSGLN